MPMQKNIFEFADKFGYESPFSDWITEEREKREEREAEKLTRYGKQAEWDNIYFAISIPAETILNPSKNPINFVYNYNASITNESPEISKQFKQLKDSFDYLNRSENDIATSYLKWVKESKLKFMFRIGLHLGRPNEIQPVTASNNNAPYQREYYVLTDCNPTMGEVIIGPDAINIKKGVPIKIFSQSGAVAKMAQEFGHNFELLFQLGEYLGIEDTLLNESKEIVFKNAGIERTIDVLPKVSIDINVISNGQKKKLNFKFMKDNEILTPLNEKDFFYKGLLKSSTPIDNLYNWGVIDLEERGRLTGLYSNFAEYIGLFFQNCFARGLKEDEFPVYSALGSKIYQGKQVEGEPTVAPKK